MLESDVSEAGKSSDDAKRLSKCCGDWLDIVRDVSESSHIAVEILNDLINYDKIESGSLKIEKKFISAEPFILKVLKLLQAHKTHHVAELIVEISESVKAITRALTDMGAVELGSEADLEKGMKLSKQHFMLGDYFKISQIIRNVVSNALKFTGSDKKVVFRGKRSVFMIIINIIAICLVSYSYNVLIFSVLASAWIARFQVITLS